MHLHVGALDRLLGSPFREMRHGRPEKMITFGVPAQKSPASGSPRGTPSAKRN